MPGFEVQIGSCEPMTVDYSRTLGIQAADAFGAMLPVSTMIRQAEWCGQAAVASVPRGTVREPAGASARAASLYPGWLVWDPASGVLLASYGRAEYRSATGVQYGYVLGRAAGDRRAFLAALASLHSDGQVAMTCRPADVDSGAAAARAAVPAAPRGGMPSPSSRCRKWHRSRSSARRAASGRGRAGSRAMERACTSRRPSGQPDP